MLKCGGCCFSKRGQMLRYLKRPLTFEQQADLLISRGLIVDDRQELIEYLSRVSYYRLSGYWYVYKQPDPYSQEEEFEPNTTFEQIKHPYEFDRKLRLLLMGAIERIEVAIFRTRMVEAFTLQFGAFGYTEYRNYNPRKFQPDAFYRLMSEIAEDQERSNEEFVQRYQVKYSDEQYLPLWMMTELMSFGSLLTMYRNFPMEIKLKIASDLGLHSIVLDSWLLSLNTIRNACAHHARVWNRPLSTTPKLPDRANDPRWYFPVPIPNNRIFTILTLVQYLLTSIAPKDHWKSSLEALMVDYPDVSTKPMGFPNNWRDCPLWTAK